MGYKITFDSGEVITFDQQPNQQDIEEAYQQLSASRKPTQSLVNQIPGLENSVAPEKPDTSLFRNMKPKEGTTDVLQNIGESLASPLETGTSLATGFTSGMAGAHLKGWNNLVTGQEGSFPQGFREGAEALTYQPRLESAQENTQVIGENLAKVLDPTMGHMTGFGVPHSVPRAGKTPKPSVEPMSTNVKASIEAANRQYAEAKILEITKKEKELEKSLVDGTASPEIQKEAERLYQQRISLQRSMGEQPTDPRYIHETLVSEQKQLEQQLREVKHRLNTEPVSDNLINLYDELSVKLEENKKQLGEVEYKPPKDDNIYEPTPHDVANSRIANAAKEKVRASEYLLEAKEKLASLDRNDPKKSSLVEALEKEIDAYTKQLNLSPKPTERPLEALKKEEVIPTPKPVEESLSPKEIDDLMANFPKERNTITDTASVGYDWDTILKADRDATREADYVEMSKQQDNVSTPRIPKGPQYELGDPKLNKQIEYQMGKYSSILARIDNKLKEMDESRAVGGSHDNEYEVSLRKQKESLENKIDDLNEFYQKSLDTPFEVKPETVITPEHLNTFKKNVSKRIYNLNKRINNIENTGPISESGKKSINRMKDKVTQLMKSLDDIDAKYKAQQEAAKPVDELPTINPELLQDAPVRINKYDSIDDIIAGSDNVARDFIDNPQLFTKSVKHEIQVDNRLLAQFPKLQNVIDTYLWGTGLGKDKIFIHLGETTQVKFSGNTSVITLSTNALGKAEAFYKNHPRLQKFLSGVDSNTFNNITLAINLGHELGHIVFTKWLQSGKVTGDTFFNIVNGFDKWQKKNNIEPFSFVNSHRPDMYHKYHAFFDEYFAERISESLMKDHLLSAFSDKRFNITKQIHALVNNMTSVLRTMGLKLTGESYRADIVNDILQGNKEEIQKTGRTIWDLWDTQRNDKLILDNPGTYPFANKTLAEIYKNPYEIYKDVPDLLNKGISEPLAWTRDQHAMPNIANFSVKALDAIGASGPWLARKMFGKTTLAQIFFNNPKLQHAHKLIRDAEFEASYKANELQFGGVTRPEWDQASVWQKFSKVKKPDSYYMATKHMTNAEATNIHSVFKQGFDAGMDYPQALAQFGSGLTTLEKQYFNILADTFKKQYDMIIGLERSLGKKNQIQYRAGWFPAVRQGDFFSTINVGGNTIHRQHFETKVAAEAWAKEMEASLPNNQYSVGPVESRLDVPNHPGTNDIIDIYDSYALNKYNINLNTISNDLKTKLAQRGGVFGQHHLHRDNLSGYKGSEIGKTSEELGHSFKQALSTNIQEFQSSYRSMKIRHTVDPLLNAQNLKQTEPQTWAAMNQMRDSALNVNKNNVKAFDDAVHEGVDRIAKAVYEAMYPYETFSPNEAVYRTIQNNLTGLFYLVKVLPSLSMFVTQLLSPLNALRHGAYDAGAFATMGNFGKGLYKLATKDPQLMDALHQVTQYSDVIEPQFIKTLHMQGENKVVEWLKDWVGMRKPQEAADILSRTMTFAYMFEQYKDVGKAMNAVDATMGAYTRGETAPMFHNLGGIIGESMRPLQTYGQMTVGNMVADIKHMVQNPTKAKSYAPFIMAGVISTVMGGAISGAIMTQYETTRKLLMSINPQWELPSLLNLIQQGVVNADNVIEDPEAAAKLIAYGIPSGMTGIDIGASTRTTETLPGNLLTILLAAVEGDSMAYDASNAISRLFPIHNNALQMTHGAAVLGKKALGGNVTDAELKQSITDVSMRGPMKNALMEATGANKTTVMGNKTDMIATGAESKALMPEGSHEKAAHWLGNLSTEERYRTDQNLANTFRDRVINNKIKRLYTLYNENPKPKYLDELIELGAVDKTIKSQLETRAFNALVDQDIRYITNKRGTVPNNPTSARKVQSLFNFGK